jgi:hypothetical protein
MPKVVVMLAPKLVRSSDERRSAEDELAKVLSGVCSLSLSMKGYHQLHVLNGQTFEEKA